MSTTGRGRKSLGPGGEGGAAAGPPGRLGGTGQGHLNLNFFAAGWRVFFAIFKSLGDAVCVTVAKTNDLNSRGGIFKVDLFQKFRRPPPGPDPGETPGEAEKGGRFRKHPPKL